MLKSNKNPSVPPNQVVPSKTRDGIAGIQTKIEFDMAVGFLCRPLEAKLRAAMPEVELTFCWAQLPKKYPMHLGIIREMLITATLECEQPIRTVDPESDCLIYSRTAAAICITVGRGITELSNEEAKIAWQTIQEIERHTKGM